MNYSYYYQTFIDYFWKYEENGSVISLSNGDTIVYKEHLLRILDRLAIQGLPSFAALLLVLGAARRKDVNSLVLKAFNQCKGEYNQLKEVEKYLKSALVLLSLISQLPESYRRGDNELLMLQTIFNLSSNQRTEKASQKIIQQFREENESEKTIIGNSFYNNLREGLRTLHNIFLQIDSIDDLLNLMKHLPQLPSEEFQLESVEKEDFNVSKFIDQLKEDLLTFRVGSLIESIWGGIYLPFKKNHSGNQPLGGFADITNKGNFDNLLTSEFANEEVVFLSRIANNEALYFQRELPPVDNDLKRVILIDISLKNWGTIKALAHAIMLAIAHHPKREEEVSVFLVGENFHSISIKKLSDIIAGLKKLSTSLNAANGLKNYFDNHQLDRQEILLITSQETMQYPEIKSLMLEYPLAIDFWIHPSIEGEVKVFKKRGTDKSFMKSIQIPFEEIWKKAKPKVKSRSRSNSNLQTLKSLNYPILFPATNRLQCQLIDEDGYLFEISKDGNLFQAPKHSVQKVTKGWRLIMENLPIRIGLFAIGQNEKGERILLMFSTGNKKVILLNLITKNRKETTIPDWKSQHQKHFIFYENCFWYPKELDTFWVINLNGDLMEQKIKGGVGRNISIDLKMEKRNAPVLRSSYYQVFKRSKVVFINEEDQLIFSSHALYLNQGRVIKIDTTKKLSAKITATSTAENVFEFPDGSQITHHRSGMLIFKSSNLAIPAFFIPSMINRGLAIASSGWFSGTDYFLYENGSMRKENTRSLFNRYVTEFVKQILHHGA
jgi:hypothetical protein